MLTRKIELIVHANGIITTADNKLFLTSKAVFTRLVDLTRGKLLPIKFNYLMYKDHGCWRWALEAQNEHSVDNNS